MVVVFLCAQGSLAYDKKIFRVLVTPVAQVTPVIMAHATPVTMAQDTPVTLAQVTPETMASQKSELFGIILKSNVNLNVSDYLKSLSSIIHPKSVKSFGKVAGNTYGIFFSNEADRDKVLQLNQITIKNVKLNVQGYTPAVKTVFIKGAPMPENEEPISTFMSQFGDIKSKPVRLPLKDVPEGFEHVLSHTLMLKMVLHSEDTSLPNYAKIDVGSDIIKVKIEHGFKKCFQCGERGHEKKLCPNNIDEFPEVNSLDNVSTAKNVFPDPEKMMLNASETTTEKLLIDLVVNDTVMDQTENVWTSAGKGKRRRGKKTRCTN